ncbi:hypothetical protein CSAL01_12958 [Colletotrichum salicis]|uniref:Uncharacterized protein n=1 Tax=Colletotrichum salicis TaxID=1209931 RepID=A0A135TZF6_9PEZI|nr:hypothetical protein CSAL01_12958 [Colletotrichum salicis]
MTFVAQGLIVCHWEGLVDHGPEQGESKAGETKAEAQKKKDTNTVGKYGATLLMSLNEDILIERVEFRYSELIEHKCTFKEAIKASEARRVQLLIEDDSEETA